MTALDTVSSSRTTYRRELEAWLQRRFRWLCLIYWLWLLLFRLILHLAEVLGLQAEELAARRPGVRLVAAVLGVALVGYFLFHRGPKLHTRSEVLGAASQMVLGLGGMSLLLGLLVGEPAPALVIDFAFWHFSACLFLPWTSRESLRPMVPLLALTGLSVLLIEGQAGRWPQAILLIGLTPIVLIPGLLICEWRLSRFSRAFRTRMLGRTLAAVRREFSQARRIHDTIFPEDFEDEYVEFRYRFRPMRELGGDFIHLHQGPDGRIDVTIVDVTGHGLSAALTVNRMYGELQRIYGETPQAEPAAVIELLNRYIHLTMSGHPIFASALTVSLDPNDGTLGWCGAGHPPLLLRRTAGALESMPASTVMLGALPPDEFTAATERTALEIGDVLILYTDGAIEARNADDELLGLDGFRHLLRRSPAPGDWPGFLESMVARHREGRADDDVLIASLRHKARRDPGNDDPAHGDAEPGS